MISAKEIKNTIQKLSTGKVPGPDKILNETIKTALEELAASLTSAATACLQENKLPKYLKTTTIVIL